MSLPAPPDQPHAEERPGVPGLHTWRGVYLVVFFWFIATVIFLALFTRAFA